ncbi:diaminopimelate epimerase [Peribacillus simplex]|uniref:Diaminopimelate epimerase n=1 Tax=Peribacillus simplex TaxID=1478 RepID=A0A109N2Q3_9BACI|nr:diaminopimelate epimerase [Peribacillus simplex]KWW22429.1 diaminopimelate epimerase [Peribacillus simplex]
MIIEGLKSHGSGNDFLIIDELTTNLTFTEQERENLAKALCNRGRLGADGILFVMKSEQADCRMRVFNADGSEASMCGNGLRCVARYANDVLGLDKMIVETMKANLLVEKTDDIYKGIPTFKVEISPVSFNVKDLPLIIEKETLQNEPLPELHSSLLFSALAVPNPHLITLVDKAILQSDLQEDLSVKVNQPNELFPDGVNVSFVKELEPGSIYVRTFERGVGFTNACGTAMSASSLVTCFAGLNELEREISVYNNGGKVKCVVHHDTENQTYLIDLIGNATYEFKVSLEIDKNHPEQFEILEKDEFEEEASLYAKLQDEVQTYLQTAL